MGKVAKYAWGIDVGNCTLKAIKLGATPDGVEVLDFAVIEYDKILTQPEMDADQRSEVVMGALGDFLADHDIKGSSVVVSVPGQNSFARFIKLPPVESKRVPELVRFEAIQQIPFDINEVEWDWQTFQTEGSPEVEVGIFAIKKELVGRAMEPFAQLSCPVAGVQMAPIAVYNFMRYDQKKSQESAGKEAVVAMDIGADNTDLVISDGIRVWQRNIPIGGNHFTTAVQKAFKLSFAKAEEIKRSANTSKYARQIFQAMRSVFADLAAEMQRSLGFYSSSNRNVRFREVLALGNAMKLPGLTKFLQQSLSLPVRRMDSFETLKLSEGVSVAKFAEALPSMAGVYGLALQGLGLATIQSDLLPTTIARQAAWRGKRMWFAASSAMVVIGSLLFLAQTYSQKSQVEQAIKNTEGIESLQRKVQDKSKGLLASKSTIDDAKKKIEDLGKYYGERVILTQILQAVKQCLPNPSNVSNPAQKAMLEAYMSGDNTKMIEMPRSQREQIFLTSVKVIYTKDINDEFGTVSQKWATGKEGGSGGGLGGSSSGGGGGGGLVSSISEDSPSGRSRSKSGGGGGGAGQPGMAMPGGPMPGGAGPGGGSGAATEGGYVIILEGYTPNSKELKFLFPPDVGLDREKWGFFNRLRFFGKTDKVIIEEKAREKQETAAGAASASAGPAKPSGPGAGRPGLAGGAKPAAAAPAPETKPAEVETTLVPVTSEYQTRNNAEMEKLPFETFIDFKKPLEKSFDTTEGDYVRGDGAQSGSSQPAGIGIPKPQSAPTSGSLTGGMSNRADGSMMSSGGMGTLQELIDPFTFEVISTAVVTDANGQAKLDGSGKPIVENHDYWFRVKLKLKMKTPSADKASAAPSATQSSKGPAAGVKKPGQ